MALTIGQLHNKLNLLGLRVDGKPVPYSVFKNKASIHKYGNGRQSRKIVFVGQPKENLFGFYGLYSKDTDINTMKDAYMVYTQLIKGDFSVYEDKIVQHGNCGIPIVYGNLRTK